MRTLVLGLPRSRTAWLANFLTHNAFFCHHEGINGCSSIEEYKAKIGSDSDSNTGLALFDVNKLFPDTNIIVIDSSITAAVKYGKEVYGVDTTEDMLTYKAKLDEIDGLHVPIASMNNGLERIWNYATNGTLFNAQRAEMLTKLDIRVKEPFNIDAIAAIKLLGSLK